MTKKTVQGHEDVYFHVPKKIFGAILVGIMYYLFWFGNLMSLNECTGVITHWDIMGVFFMVITGIMGIILIINMIND